MKKIIISALILLSSIQAEPLPSADDVFNRCDYDYNNILIGAETENAAKIYRNILIVSAKLKGKHKKLAKPLFYYLAIKHQIPTPLQLYFYSKTYRPQRIKLKLDDLKAIDSLLYRK